MLSLCSALTATSSAFAAPQGSETRLTPPEIAAMAKGGAGAGTSGVTGMQTTTLNGDPAVAGPYTIALRVPANMRIAAHTHRLWRLGRRSCRQASRLRQLLYRTGRRAGFCADP